MSAMIFETSRLTVRQYSEDDAGGFYRLNSDPEVMKYIRPPKSRIEAWEFLRQNIEYYQEFPKYGRWAIVDKSSRQYLGSFMLRPSSAVQHRIELGYALLKEFWGKGLATEVVLGGLAFAFARLQLDSLIAITQPGNILSQKVLLNCGFTFREDIQANDGIINLFSIEKTQYDRNLASSYRTVKQ